MHRAARWVSPSSYRVHVSTTFAPLSVTQVTIQGFFLEREKLTRPRWDSAAALGILLILVEQKENWGKQRNIHEHPELIDGQCFLPRTNDSKGQGAEQLRCRNLPVQASVAGNQINGGKRGRNERKQHETFTHPDGPWVWQAESAPSQSVPFCVFDGRAVHPAQSCKNRAGLQESGAPLRHLLPDRKARAKRKQNAHQHFLGQQPPAPR